MDNYILDGKVAKPIGNILEWAKWYEGADRIVKKTKLPNHVEVSTVFLGLDHSFGNGKPLLFETMVFGGEYDQHTERYSTYEEAEKGHDEVINLIFS